MNRNTGKLQNLRFHLNFRVPAKLEGYGRDPAQTRKLVQPGKANDCGQHIFWKTTTKFGILKRCRKNMIC